MRLLPKLQELQRLPFQIEPIISLLPRALKIGLAHQLAVYDSLYIALAEQLKIPLISVDDRQVRASVLEGVAIKPITDFHS